MKIMVFDVPAESGGALSVLNDFYKEYSNDEKNEYIFVVSKPELKDTKNIKVLRFPWIKKSWFHRLYFDNFIAHKLVKKYEVGEILSLQNIIVPNCKCKQTVYVHNSIPFSEYRFSLRENKLLWIYQNVLSKLIFRSIEKADKVIVQTNWMKNACIEKIKIDDKKVQVVSPKINLDIKKYYKNEKSDIKTFFYPASAVVFKNHKVIVNSCLELKKQGFDNYRIIFTIKGNENRYIKKLYDICLSNNLPVEFIGDIDREAVLEYYNKSILIFSSYIETVGLPLIEAKKVGCPIIASDCNFAHEVLDNYEKSYFFNPFKYKELCYFIKYFIRMSKE